MTVRHILYRIVRMELDPETRFSGLYESMAYKEEHSSCSSTRLREFKLPKEWPIYILDLFLLHSNTLSIIRRFLAAHITVNCTTGSLGFVIGCSYIEYTWNEVSLANPNHSCLLIPCILAGAVGMFRFPEQIYSSDSASASYSCYFARLNPHASTVQPFPII
jgi:hypothetical protein